MHKKKQKKTRKGQNPETLKIEGDWEDSISKAIQKKKPKEGWPEKEEGEARINKDV